MQLSRRPISDNHDLNLSSLLPDYDRCFDFFHFSPTNESND